MPETLSKIRELLEALEEEFNDDDFQDYSDSEDYGVMLGWIRALNVVEVWLEQDEKE